MWFTDWNINCSCNHESIQHRSKGNSSAAIHDTFSQTTTWHGVAQTVGIIIIDAVGVSFSDKDWIRRHFVCCTATFCVAWHSCWLNLLASCGVHLKVQCSIILPFLALYRVSKTLICFCWIRIASLKMLYDSRPWIVFEAWSGQTAQ